MRHTARMYEMVNRVARAIGDVADARAAAEGCDDVGILDADLLLDMAATAIATLREPTDEMWEGWRSVNCVKGTDGMEEFTSFAGDYGNWLACHHAMIDAAGGKPVANDT